MTQEEMRSLKMGDILMFRATKCAFTGTIISNGQILVEFIDPPPSNYGWKGRTEEYRDYTPQYTRRFWYLYKDDLSVTPKTILHNIFN